mmetsp:Transcript_10220/g.42867  ORF Transcript_10220/g.42867 Transcript_10220/m.42867 type:complete len:239 (+) Transcript_10220:194-910(+)
MALKLSRPPVSITVSPVIPHVPDHHRGLGCILICCYDANFSREVPELRYILEPWTPPNIHRIIWTSIHGKKFVDLLYWEVVYNLFPFVVTIERQLIDHWSVPQELLLFFRLIRLWCHVHIIQPCMSAFAVLVRHPRLDTRYHLRLPRGEFSRQKWGEELRSYWWMGLIPHLPITSQRQDPVAVPTLQPTPVAKSSELSMRLAAFHRYRRQAAQHLARPSKTGALSPNSLKTTRKTRNP